MALKFKRDYYTNLMRQESIIYNYHDNYKMMYSYTDSVMRWHERHDSELVITTVCTVEVDGRPGLDIRTSSLDGTSIDINRNLLYPDAHDDL